MKHDEKWYVAEIAKSIGIDPHEFFLRLRHAADRSRSFYTSLVDQYLDWPNDYDYNRLVRLNIDTKIVERRTLRSSERRKLRNG